MRIQFLGFVFPRAANSNNVWNVYGSSRYVDYNNAVSAVNYGVRPAIEVSKSDISY